MGKHYFTTEQIELLNQNRFVKRVSKKAITYTEEFKEIFLLEYDYGKMPSVILREMGFDCKALGRKRIDNIVQNIKKQSIRPERFKDTRADCPHMGRPSSNDLTAEEIIFKQNAEIKLLKAKVEYLSVLKQIERTKGKKIKNRHNSK
ncbi:MAG: hypothetical protein K2I42_05790 [Anaeroplasmataceae bacterium]|nr:hypothetical protein [Anaeroplasmataceae bacterium]